MDAVSEPGGANLTLLAGLFEDDLAVYAGGGLAADGSMTGGPYLSVPHDAVVPAPVQVSDSVLPVVSASRVPVRFTNPVDAQNRPAGKPSPAAEAARWVIETLGAGRR